MDNDLDLVPFAQRWPALKIRLEDALYAFQCSLEACAREVVEGPQQSTTSRGTPFTTYGLHGAKYEGQAPFLLPVDGEEGDVVDRFVDYLTIIHTNLVKEMHERPRLVWRKKPEVHVRDAHTEGEIAQFLPAYVLTVPHVWVRMRLALETLEQ